MSYPRDRKRARRIDDALAAAIIAAYRSDIPVAKIAKQYDIGRFTIYGVLKRAGFRERRYVTKTVLAEMQRLRVRLAEVTAERDTLSGAAGAMLETIDDDCGDEVELNRLRYEELTGDRMRPRMPPAEMEAYWTRFHSWVRARVVALRAALAAGAEPTHRHRKGGLYRLIGYGRHSETGDELAFYAGEDGRLWARPRAMFDDGRFERIGPAGQNASVADGSTPAADLRAARVGV